MGSKYFHRFIAVTLLFALLLVSGGRAICVSALAQPDWSIAAEYAPIYDTEIINIEDYMGSHLSSSQLDVFWLLMGVYVVAQGGSEQYKLRNPYANESGVVNWLKDCGIQLWNAMVGLNMTPIDPVTGISWADLAKKAQDVAMGAAVKASSYDDMNDFLSDVEAKDKYLVPFMPDIQTALNYIFQKSGGLYDWQFDTGEFIPNLEYNSYGVIPPNSDYWNLVMSLVPPIVRFNPDVSSYKNGVFTSDLFETYRNMFFDTSTHKIRFVDDNGNICTSSSFQARGVRASSLNNASSVNYGYLSFNSGVSYNTSLTYQELVQYYLDHPTLIFPDFPIFMNDFIQHYYYGSSWNNKTEIFNSTDLNLDVNTIPYYLQIGNDYLLDIKGIIDDLILPTINLKDVLINNLFDLEGVVVTDPVLTQVALDILYEIQTQNIPIPVNLNEVSELTENTYMDLVKESATEAGHTLAELVAFWHNCDAEIIYALFGAGLTVLVGAFIGKWGHS